MTFSHSLQKFAILCTGTGTCRYVYPNVSQSCRSCIQQPLFYSVPPCHDLWGCFASSKRATEILTYRDCNQAKKNTLPICLSLLVLCVWQITRDIFFAQIFGSNLLSTLEKYSTSASSVLLGGNGKDACKDSDSPLYFKKT